MKKAVFIRFSDVDGRTCFVNLSFIAAVFQLYDEGGNSLGCARIVTSDGNNFVFAGTAEGIFSDFQDAGLAAYIERRGK